MSNDPFAEPSDNERTIMRPRPGGAPGRAEPPAARRGVVVEAPVPAVGANPLLAAAAPVLAAVVRLANLHGGAGPDIERLRAGMVEAVRGFEKAALPTGLDSRSLRAARYALCATIDDVVLSTPWGSASNWARQTLTSIFHNEVTGGERFFEIMDQMQRELGRHSEVVELMYLCISLGFEGRYRVMPRGIAAHTEVRQQSYRAIRTRRGDFERELSPHWRGVERQHRALSQRVPLWAIALGSLVLLCLIYLGFNLALSGRSDAAFATLYAIPPTGAATVPRPAPVAPPPPVIAAVSMTGAATKLHQFLAPEIKQGLVTVFQDAQSVTVRLANRNMFASGSASLASTENGVLARIGDALQDEKGQVLVNGYTDSQKIRSARFPSNFQLSQARADAVSAVIGTHLTDHSRLRAVGRGEADPIATNDTAEGRQENRRTEIVLVRTAD